ncbi:MAG: DnaA N-terminal domain-containing protein, partial [Nitriliruptor sp.]|uniref:DnaA N-terminal domain-containing protein n=1 Tax=Nitriliruptor sp. TaxID=2448056 RepID=UPI0034A04ECF
MSRPSTLDLEALWRDARDEVMRAVTSTAQRHWLEASRPVGYTDDVVVLATPHDFARAWLETRCGELIRTALSEAAGRDLTVVITVQPRPEPVGDLTAAETELAGPAGDDGDATSRPDTGPSAVPSDPRDAGRDHRPTPPGLRSDRREDRSWAASSPTGSSQPPTVRSRSSAEPLDDHHATQGGASRDDLRDQQDRYAHQGQRELRAVPDEQSDTEPATDEAGRPLEAPGRPPGPVVSLPDPRPRPRDRDE